MPPRTPCDKTIDRQTVVSPSDQTGPGTQLPLRVDRTVAKAGSSPRALSLRGKGA